jgi:hypothetical protein
MYTGLGCVGSKDVSDWLRKSLRAKPTLEDSAQYMADRAGRRSVPVV